MASTNVLPLKAVPLVASPSTSNWNRELLGSSARDNRYCPQRSLALAKFSDLAYCSRRKIQKTLQSWGFETVEFFSLGYTEAFLAADSEQIIVTFRGSDEPRDWIQNFKFDLVPFYRRSSRPSPQDNRTGWVGQVHGGFLAVVGEVWKAIQRIICKLRVQARWQGRELSLWFTGHSLGGALATLVTAQLRQTGVPISGLYTYASPRVGDRAFAQAFNINFGFKTFRLVNKNDLIPRMPLQSLGYRHVGQLFYFDHRNQLHSQSSAYFRFLDSLKVHANDLFDLDFSAAENHDIAAYLEVLSDSAQLQQDAIAHYPPLRPAAADTRRTAYAPRSSPTESHPEPV